MSIAKNKLAEGDKLMGKANKLLSSSVLSLRFKPDWESAGPLLDQAAHLYKQANVPEKTRLAHEKAAQCQEKMGSPYHAARHFESAAAAALQLGDFDGTVTLYNLAAHMYFDAGRSQAGADALSKGAKAVEEDQPDRASELYLQALDTLEHGDRFTIASDIFRQAVGHEVKRQNWDDAVALLLKFGEMCSANKMETSQVRCYLGAVVVWLFAGNGEQAWAVFQDCIRLHTFASSEEGRAAERLIEAYKNNSPDEIKTLVKKSACFQFLDTPVGRLAIKLPKGDIERIAQALGAAGNAAGGDGLDDDDGSDLC